MSECGWKHSNYNIFVKLDDNSFAIYNTFSGALAIVDAQAKKQYDDLNGNLESFVQNGFVIPEWTSEESIMEFDRMYFAVASNPAFRILTTTACNASCDYCYEAGIKPLTMAKKTAMEVANFIIENSGGKKVKIDWFGGEPLLNVEAIQVICNILQSAAIEYESSVTTNGLLFKNISIDDFKELTHLKKVQITIDGVPRVYEKVKHVPFGSFESLMSSINRLSSHNIYVYIRFNIGNNIDDILNLIDILPSYIHKNEYISCYAYPLFSACDEVSQDTVRDLFVINDRIVEHGLVDKKAIYRYRYKCTGCFATTACGYTIAPDGKLYTCSHVMNERGYIGDINRYSIYHPHKLEYMSQKVDKICMECKLYPVCKGGCPTARLRLAPMNRCSVYKSAIEPMIRKMVEYSE